MKNILAIMACILASSNAMAGAMAGAKSFNEESNNAIIIPDVATTMWRTSRWTYDKDMNILICPVGMEMGDNKCYNKKEENKWVKVDNFSPGGKKYVGFKSVNQGSSHYLEFYFK